MFRCRGEQLKKLNKNLVNKSREVSRNLRKGFRAPSSPFAAGQPLCGGNLDELAKNYVSNSRTKHIERRHLKIRELVEELAVRPEFVPTDGNVADILSKPLGRDKFEKFRRVLLNHEV